MSDICKYCKREKFASAAEYDDDFDAKLNKCGRGVAGHEGTYDCLSEMHHRCNRRRMKAEALLRSASMLHLMSRDYQDRFTAEYSAFRAQFPDD